MIWADYRGTDVVQIGALRGAVREAGAECVVVKNSLMQLALKQAGLPVDAEIMSGPRLVTFVSDDIGAAAKALASFARVNADVFKIAGGLVGSAVLDAGQAQALTEMPSREVLLARVVGGIQAPISGFVGTLAAVVRGVMNVLNARAEQLEGASA